LVIGLASFAFSLSIMICHHLTANFPISPQGEQPAVPERVILRPFKPIKLIKTTCRLSADISFRD
jgi:hypothetical protein